MPATPAQAQDQRCFEATGFCISGPIRTYWERNGGLIVFGYPITEQRVETVEGRTIQVQWFERDRLEIQADGTITAGRLGARYLELTGRPWQSFAKDTPTPATTPECRYFAETGFNVCSGIRTYWEQNGGLERFGYPISPVLGEEIEGRVLSVQYFERRRIEIHPENNPPYNVLLGLLGREVLRLEGAQQPPAATPLAGTSWEWVRLSDPVQQYEIQNPAAYTLTFENNTNLSIRADCNTVRGTYTATADGALSIALGASTQVACPPGSRGDEFTRRLSAAAIWFFRDGNLFIDQFADGGTLEFRRAGATGDAVVDVLSGTAWRWTRLNDPNGPVEIGNPNNYTIAFSNGQVSVRADCNQVNGTYRIGSGQSLTIAINATTLAACPDGSRGNEFTDRLNSVVRYFFQGNTLFLELPFDGGTLQFER
jgi:heat shock protein HslJ